MSKTNSGFRELFLCPHFILNEEGVDYSTGIGSTPESKGGQQKRPPKVDLLSALLLYKNQSSLASIKSNNLINSEDKPWNR